MRNNIKLLTYILLCGVLWASCKKETPVSYGTPVITRVAQPTNSAAITTGSFTQWVIIYGQNLASADSVLFNDQLVAYKDLYADDTTVTVQIPRAIPENVSNTVTVFTKGGKATFTFTVQIPALVVTGMFNEYVAEGDTLKIIGQNFDLYGFAKEGTTVTFTGGKTATLTAASATTLAMIVPAGVQPGPLAVKGAAPLNTEVTTKAWYKDNRNMLFGMSPFTGWNGNSWISNGPTPAPLNGPYFKIQKSWNGGWAWDPYCSNNATIPAEIVNDPSKLANYALKFEMNIPAGSPALPQPLYFVFQGNGFKEYFFDPSGRGSYPFTTNGKWQTFICPMTNFAGYGFQTTTIFETMLKYGDPFSSNFAICNFRIVPN